jgi:tRNA dimethylallyltransferase
VRADLSAQLASAGLAALYERLARLDPVAAARIHPHDTQRILRALEVHAITGRSITELYARQHDESLVYKIVKLVLAPVDRQLLHRCIEQRFQRMLAQGFVAEVERLHGRGDLNLDKPSMRAVGYRQVWEYLEGQSDYPEMCRRVLAATRQFAKRQLTWLRAEPETSWSDSQSPRLWAQVLGRLQTEGVLLR